MARAIRSVTIERGRDPREMALMAFGGGGALHAVEVARLLGIRTVLVPPLSGVFCALGMLAADIEHSFVRAVIRPLQDIRSEEHTSELQSLMRISYAVLCLKTTPNTQQSNNLPMLHFNI